MRSVIWDLGGTVVDSYPDVDRALARVVHSEVDDAALHEVALLTRVSSSHAISVLARRYGVAEARLRDAYDELRERWRERPAPLMPGVGAVMGAVRAGGGLNLMATHRDRASASVLVRRSGLEIDDMVCAPDGFARKPDPAMALALLERHGLAAGECLAVGDRTADVEAAVAAGVTAFLLVTPGVPLEAPGGRRISALRDLLEALGDVSGPAAPDPGACGPPRHAGSG